MSRPMIRLKTESGEDVDFEIDDDGALAVDLEEEHRYFYLRRDGLPKLRDFLMEHVK